MFKAFGRITAKKQFFPSLSFHHSYFPHNLKKAVGIKDK